MGRYINLDAVLISMSNSNSNYQNLIFEMFRCRGVQGPDPESNPDGVGQYNPEHRFSTAIVRGWSLDGAEFKTNYLVASVTRPMYLLSQALN